MDERYGPEESQSRPRPELHQERNVEVQVEGENRKEFARHQEKYTHHSVERKEQA